MHHFDYIDGEMHAENVPIQQIADEIGTPFYVYSTATLVRHYQVFAGALTALGLDSEVFYAIKANSNLSVIATLAAEGAGADIVSEGEMRRAMAAGVPASRIVYSGVGKSEAELTFALSENVHQINVESDSELETLSRLASSMGKTARIAIRVNPDVDAKTHAKISTGKKENKFGIDIDRAEEIYARAAALPGIEPVSVAVHIGSQLTELEPYRATFVRVAELVRRLRELGHDIRHLDLGGGLGIPYTAAQSNSPPPAPDDYARVVADTLGDIGCKLAFEPGRMIVGNAGMLIAKTLIVKQGEARRFLVLDAAMNDLIRPALYEGHHEIKPVKEPNPKTPVQAHDVVGPVCETGDTFATERALPLINEGELVAFGSAGAYGAVMASTYNSRPLIPEVLVSDDQFSVVRPRQTYEMLLGMDRIADWLPADQENAD